MAGTSRPSKGSTGHGTSHAVQAGPVQRTSRERESPLSEARTVLLVEDNPDNVVVYTTILEHYGFRVLQADNGLDAIERARDEQPDIVIMDISIPGIDGWTATERLQGDPATSGIPVVAVTAHALPEHMERARALGCAGYLTKPCEPRRLVGEILRIIG